MSAEHPSTPAEGVRVTVFLPVNDESERAAAQVIIARINDAFKGSTSTTLKPAPLIGTWYHDGRWYTDENAAVVLDVRRQDAAGPELLNKMNSLRNLVFDAYKRLAEPGQSEVWVVACPAALYIGTG